MRLAAGATDDLDTLTNGFGVISRPGYELRITVEYDAGGESTVLAALEATTQNVMRQIDATQAKNTAKEGQS